VDAHRRLRPEVRHHHIACPSKYIPSRDTHTSYMQRTYSIFKLLQIK
jgi:hypothetical protein